MSELEPEFLRNNTEGVTTLAEAFGFPLFDLHICDEEGVEVSARVREKVMTSILGAENVENQ